MDFSSCLEKQSRLKKIFDALPSKEERYNKIIQLGRSSPRMSKEDQKEEYRVPGCQSLLYLKVTSIHGVLSIQTTSDALISAGLAQLLVEVYDGEPPLAVTHCPPLFLKELGILEALSPSRANGLKSLYQKLQKESLKFLISI
jgi:cysteine desulfuration protein SufE